MSCEYCSKKEPLDSVAAKRLTDTVIKYKFTELCRGAVILPDKKILEINLGTKYGAKEISILNVPISYCPMCGEELLSEPT